MTRRPQEPPHALKALLTSLCSRLHHTRSEKGGKEEARPCEGKKAADMGQEIVQRHRLAIALRSVHERQRWLGYPRRILFLL